ncbi:MAG: hypothetical protein KatS3mg031_2669 [Chitinophagales bacterium]|nr:MAG: hypothetical protein KatS3mg031_2669 [Chitinophagales bacterium]
MAKKRKTEAKVKPKPAPKVKASEEKQKGNKRASSSKSKKTQGKSLTIPSINYKKPEPAPQASAKTKEEAKPKTTPAPPPLKVESQPGGKKRLIISYEKLPPEVMEVIRTKYPYGYNHDLKEVKGLDNRKFFVLPIETTEAIYLVKVDLKRPIKVADMEDEDELFPQEDSFGGDEDTFPTEDLEQIEEEEDEEPPKRRGRRDDEDDDDDI